MPPSPVAAHQMQPPTSSSKTPRILIVLIVVLLGVASYFGYQNYQLRKQVLNNPADVTLPSASQPMNSPQNTTTTDDSSWKQYVGDNYSFGYPSWFMVDTSNIHGPVIYPQTENPNPNECSGGGCFLGYRPLSITFGDEKNSQSLADIAKDKIEWIKNIFGNDVKINSINSTFAGYPSIIIENQCVGYCITVLFKNTDNSLFTITQIYGSKSASAAYKSISDQILSTFKFTE